MTIRKSLKAIKPVYKTYIFYLNCLAYLKFNVELAKQVYRDRKYHQDPTNEVVPPARLRHRVHGSLNRDSFLEIGKVVSQEIRDLCTVVGRDFYSFENILDFGCGSGRVLRNFQNAPESCHLYGTDIDPDLVDWCRNNLDRIQWSVNGFQPPLPFEENTFDLIYAISVFTHLDEKLQHSWLGELRRIAKPGALILLTVHGETSIQLLDSTSQEEVRSQGFLYTTGTKGLLKLDGLPDFYQTTYHTQKYIFREWSAYFDISDYIERGIANYQDVVLLRKT